MNPKDSYCRSPILELVLHWQVLYTQVLRLKNGRQSLLRALTVWGCIGASVSGTYCHPAAINPGCRCRSLVTVRQAR